MHGPIPHADQLVNVVNANGLLHQVRNSSKRIKIILFQFNKSMQYESIINQLFLHACMPISDC